MNINYIFSKNRRIYLIKLFLLILILLSSVYLINKYELIQKNRLNEKINALPRYNKEILNYYFSNISSKFEKVKNKEINNLISLFSLYNYSDLTNNITKHQLKIKLLNALQKHPKKDNIFLKREDEIVFVEKSFNFGNSLVLLNNLLYYCEILNITNIYLNSNYNWPISQNISSNQININLISPENLDLKKKNIIIFDKKLVYFQKIFKPEIRINILKNEIKHNLPKIKLKENDLYIHIRGGDIFEYNAKKNINYAQPPLCFYIKVLSMFKFDNIFILSMDNSNPVINKLINQYPQIILTHNSLEIDIAIISNAVNIVGSMSSFLTSLIIINDNLKNFWEYDNYSLSQKYLHLHHDIYKYENKYTIYKIKPSLRYLKEMFPWESSKHQIELMLNDKCNNFIKITPSKSNY